MIKNRALWTVIGFLLLSAGLLSIILSMVGLEWKPLQIIYGMGALMTIIFQIILIIAGFAVLFVARNSAGE